MALDRLALFFAKYIQQAKSKRQKRKTNSHKIMFLSLSLSFSISLSRSLYFFLLLWFVCALVNSNARCVPICSDKENFVSFSINSHFQNEEKKWIVLCIMVGSHIENSMSWTKYYLTNSRDCFSHCATTDPKRKETHVYMYVGFTFMMAEWKIMNKIVIFLFTL